MNLHLVLIETSGNQQYIFATNKLRENVGASELTYRAGTEWVLEAVKDVGGPTLWVEVAAQLRENLLDGTLNPPIEKGEYPVEVIMAASGKALLLVVNEKIGQQIIQIVTNRALKEAPGLDIYGLIRAFDSNEVIEEDGRKMPVVSRINREIQEQFEVERAHRPGPAMRFLRLPCVADCATSGLPASKWDRKNLNDEERQRGEEPQARSQVSLKKRDNYTIYRERMKNTFDSHNFAHDITEMEEHCEWLAVVHSDGNGLGKIFQNFGKHSMANNHQQFVDKLRRFSLALDECTENAFRQAIRKLPKYKRKDQQRFALVPIVLGGDDMTVVCDGRAALWFTHEFLTGFERETQANEITKEIAKDAYNEARLAACAGVAVVKPHYPFSGAYDLAEKLIESAKQVKKIVYIPNDESRPWPCSALDFHILYDASGSELKPIRRKLEFKNSATRLYGRPYVVTPENWLTGADEKGRRWVAQHLWKDLEESIKIVLAEDEDGRRLLPNSQLHDLRAGLFLGSEAADARFRLIRNRYADKGIKRLCGDAEHTLFIKDVMPRKEWKVEYFTRLLDVMDAASLWADREKL